MDMNQTATQRLYNTSYQPKSKSYLMDVGPRTDLGRKKNMRCVTDFDMYWFDHIFELSDKHCILFCRTCCYIQVLKVCFMFHVFYLLNNQRKINLSVFTWFTYSPCKRFYCFSFISNSLVICSSFVHHCLCQCQLNWCKRPWQMLMYSINKWW